MNRLRANLSPLGKPLITLLLVAGIIRVAVVVLLADNLESDPDAYRLLAESTYRHGVFGLSEERATAFRPPLYPLLLVPLAAGAGLTATKVGALHVFLGLLTLLATVAVAHAWGLSRLQQLVAMSLVAVDPILLYQSTFVMTETPATLLALLVLVALTWAIPRASDRGSKWMVRGSTAGVLLGLAMLCRPTFLLWAPWIVVGYLRATGPGKNRLLGGGSLLLALALTLAPWTLRNYWLLGSPIYATTHGGYTLWLANNPSLYEYWRTGPHERVWEATPIDAEQARIFREVESDEVAADQVAYSRAWSSIEGDPQMFLYGCFHRCGQLWNPLPHRVVIPESRAQHLARWTIAVWYVGLYSLALVGAVRIGRRWTAPPWIWGVGLLLAMTLAHTFYWSNIRMRAPLIPLIAMVAAVGVGSPARPTQEPRST